MVRKDLKYKLYRTCKGVLFSSSIFFSTLFYQRQYTSISSMQLGDTYTFEQDLNELTQIKKEDVVFENQQLKEIIQQEALKEKVDVTEITHLEINEHIEEGLYYFSDLKYLSKLEYLAISSNCIDLEDIQFNQNLEELYLYDCLFFHSESIPNTVRKLQCSSCLCLDNVLVVPYCTNSLSFVNKESGPLRFSLKNPKALEELGVAGVSFVDLEDFASCSHLKRLAFIKVADVKHPEIFVWLSQFATISLDDYCPIWLNEELLDCISMDNKLKSTYKKEIQQLDSIANFLDRGQKSLSDEEKIKRIVSYIVKQLAYDLDVLNQTSLSDSKVTMYNQNPLFYALNSDTGVCINYACLFSALANRFGLSSHQIFGNSHTWNLVEQKKDATYLGYDCTNLDRDYSLVTIEDGKKVTKTISIEEILESNKEKNLPYYGFSIDAFNYEQANLLHLDLEQYQEKVAIGYINDAIILRLKQEDKINFFCIMELVVDVSLLEIFIKELYDVIKSEQSEKDKKVKVLKK